MPLLRKAARFVFGYRRRHSYPVPVSWEHPRAQGQGQSPGAGAGTRRAWHVPAEQECGRGDRGR